MQEIINISKQAQLQSILQAHLKESSLLKLIPLIAIIGPTASGKTALGIFLAKQFSGEIISADSRQIYRQMSIGTAAPTDSEKSAAKHYLVEEFDPDQPFSLADFQKSATQLIQKIYSAGHLPILVGGTGLYVSAVAQNYQLPASQAEPALRQKYEELATKKGNQAVHQILQKLDPQSAQRIHPNNLRYVIRAIEVASHTNQTKKDQKGTSPYHTLFIQIDWPRDQLYQRVEKRIDQQITSGMIEETAALLQKYGRQLPALSSLGYQEIADYLQGETDLPHALELFKKNTRNFAKRQLTWFRKFPKVYSISGNDLPAILSATA